MYQYPIIQIRFFYVHKADKFYSNLVSIKKSIFTQRWFFIQLHIKSSSINPIERILGSIYNPKSQMRQNSLDQGKNSPSHILNGYFILLACNFNSYHWKFGPPKFFNGSSLLLTRLFNLCPWAVSPFPNNQESGCNI